MLECVSPTASLQSWGRNLSKISAHSLPKDEQTDIGVICPFWFALVHKVDGRPPIFPKGHLWQQRFSLTFSPKRSPERIQLHLTSPLASRWKPSFARLVGAAEVAESAVWGLHPAAAAAHLRGAAALAGSAQEAPGSVSTDRSREIRRPGLWVWEVPWIFGVTVPFLFMCCCLLK